MDTAENTQHHFRSSVIRPPSNLPRPGTISSGLGLSEMSESQNNARAQPSMIPPPASKIGSLNSAMKRDVPKPGWFFLPERRWEWWRLLTAPSTAELPASKHQKSLAERAGEYPTKSSTTTAGATGIARARSVRGHTLAEVGFLCIPSASHLIPERHVESMEMASESSTPPSIVPRVDTIRIVLWAVVHLFRSTQRILRRSSAVFLVAFSLH
ncbi:hypothetical protein ColLi_12096 [Colletotrichum liriopes]|uniref:Uncharacterized protein n=1 Tax=Colletotrichum liriopes TaxID=708192 RepID=A0AA37H0B6_9PEZI|nr:hypothetical protein ColLi_12096 [Colletotrichum liriopes]